MTLITIIISAQNFAAEASVSVKVCQTSANNIICLHL